MKFSVNSNNLKEEVLFKCIEQRSAYMQRFLPQEFYTYQNKPDDWTQQMIADVRKARRVIYNGQEYLISETRGRVLWIFNHGYVFYPDQYFSDCPIFKEILKND